MALSLGVLGTIKYFKEIHETLARLWQDKNPLVKQAVGISFGLLHQKNNPSNNKECQEAFDLLNKEIDNKNALKILVFGAVVGLGLMFSGGQNT